MVKSMNIYVLTLKRSIDRQRSIQEQFDRIGIPFRFLYGVYGNDLSDEEIARVYDDSLAWKTINRGLTKNEVACAIGHRMFYEIAMNSPTDGAIILEDDALLGDAFVEVVRFLERYTSEYPILMKLDVEKPFRHNIWRKIPVDQGIEFLRPIQGVFLTTGYYINRKAATKMWNHTKTIIVPSDYYSHIAKGVKLYNINRAVVSQSDSTPSIIGQRAVSSRNERQFLASIVRKARRFIMMLNPFL